MELLRAVRKIPAADWPVAREALCGGMDWVTELVSPGATAARKAEARETLGKLMDRARALSEFISPPVNHRGLNAPLAITLLLRVAIVRQR